MIKGKKKKNKAITQQNLEESREEILAKGKKSLSFSIRKAPFGDYYDSYFDCRISLLCDCWMDSVV